MKIKQLLRLEQDPLGLQVSGVYKITCMCGTYCIGETGRSTLIKWKKHQHHLRLGNMKKSALADHGWKTGHTIQFDKAKILYKSD